MVSCEEFVGFKYNHKSTWTIAAKGSMGNTEVDILVIGAGVAGLSAAHVLAIMVTVFTSLRLLTVLEVEPIARGCQILLGLIWDALIFMKVRLIRSRKLLVN